MNLHDFEAGMPGGSAQPGGNDPCLPIQADLSAMLDGELDAASVRRVMVHSDLCPACRTFLRGIRQQAQLHRTVRAAARVAVGAGVDGPQDTQAARLWRELCDNRRRLAKILNELGRGFALMGLSPVFSREVGKEPVPLPDMAMRGRSFLDEVTRWAKGNGQCEAEWVAAEELFEHRPRSSVENLAKGQRLLSECLALDEGHHEARIYLGLVHSVRGQRSLARRQFERVLAVASAPHMRAFALLNLANVHMQEGDPEGAVRMLAELVASGVVQQAPRFGMAYFNLALCHFLMRRFDDSHAWFRRLHEEMPHKRSMVAKELAKRSQFVHLLRCHPEVEQRLAADFPNWFPLCVTEPN